MNQMRRCTALIGLALALAVWSSGSVAWHKGAYHSEPEPWEVQSEPSSAPQHETDQLTTRSEATVAPAEDLKELRAEFSGYAYVSPPRTTADITELLGPERPVPECDRAGRSQLIFKPVTYKRKQLVFIYNYYSSFAHRRFVMGDVRKSVDYIESLIQKLPDDMWSGRTAAFYILAKYHGYLGNFGAAEDALGEASYHYNAARRWSRSYISRWGGLIEYREAVAKSFIQQSKGNYVGSEKYLRNAITLNSKIRYFRGGVFGEYIVLLAELAGMFTLTKLGSAFVLPVR